MATAAAAYRVSHDAEKCAHEEYSELEPTTRRKRMIRFVLNKTRNTPLLTMQITIGK